MPCNHTKDMIKFSKRRDCVEPFQMTIAGLPVQVRPLFETTAVYCRNYLTDADPACAIAISEDDLYFEQNMLDIEASEEGMKLRKFTGPFLERAAIQRKIAEELLKRTRCCCTAVPLRWMVLLISSQLPAVRENLPTPDCGGKFSEIGLSWSTMISLF